MSDSTLARVQYLRAADDAMAPLVPDGAALQVLPDRAPVAGDLVVVADEDDHCIRLLVEDDLDYWLVAIRGAAPCVLVPPLAVVGVVSQVIEHL